MHQRHGHSGPVTVGDVATVVQGDKQQYNLQRLNGQDAVGLSITANSDANTVQVADAVARRAQAAADRCCRRARRITVVNDQSVFTRASLDSIQHDLALAIILVAVVILVFLHDWKHTVIVLCAIPTSLISTFLVMYLLGFTLNTMSMMALALMIGILVDDSIVVLENIHRHLQLGESPWQAALNGRSEIGMAAIAITHGRRGRLHADRLHVGLDRPAVPPVRPDRRRGHAVLDADVVHADADAGVALAAARRAARPLPAADRFGAAGGTAASQRLSDFFANSVPHHGARALAGAARRRRWWSRRVAR